MALFGGGSGASIASGPYGAIIEGTRAGANKAGVGGHWTTGNPFEKLRQAGEKAAGINDVDIAGSFDPSKFFQAGIGPQSGFRGQQSSLAQMLMQRAQGQGPSLTDALVNQQRQQGFNNISAQTASARGVNPALAARGAQMASANLSAQLNQQRVAGNLQEQQAAQQSLGGLLAQARGQDMQYQQMGVDQRNLVANARLQEALQRQQLNAQGRMGTRDNRYNNWVQQQESGRQMLSSMGGAMAMSDERAKHNIEHINKEDVSEFMSAIKPKTFNYNDTTQEGTAEGDRIGFVLQDVAHTKLGKKLIRTNKDGMLMYDRDNLNGIILAALAHR